MLDPQSNYLQVFEKPRCITCHFRWEDGLCHRLPPNSDGWPLAPDNGGCGLHSLFGYPNSCGNITVTYPGGDPSAKAITITLAPVQDPLPYDQTSITWSTPTPTPK